MTVYAVFKGECADAHFCSKIIDTVTQVLSAFSCNKMITQFSNNWIYKVVRVSRSIDKCSYKLKKLVTLNLQILQQICETRVSEQLLNFMKIFKEFSEEFDVSFIGYDP